MERFCLGKDTAVKEESHLVTYPRAAMEIIDELKGEVLAQDGALHEEIEIAFALYSDYMSYPSDALLNRLFQLAELNEDFTLDEVHSYLAQHLIRYWIGALRRNRCLDWSTMEKMRETLCGLLKNRIPVGLVRAI
jgi:hypothetical protein